MANLLPVLIVGGVLVLIGVFIYFGYVYEKKRTTSLKGIADSLGLPFYEKGDSALLTVLGAFRLFSQGRAKTISNMIHGVTDDVDMAIFDYRYTTGSGKQQATLKQSVIYFDSRLLSLPDFTIRPEHLFHKLGKVIGLKDIDFESHPNFSKKFWLQGSNETEIRKRFTPQVIAWFESKAHLSAEGLGTHLLLYHAGRRAAPENINKLMADAFELYGLLRDSSASEVA